MQMIAIRRSAYYLAFAVACVFFCVHLVNPNVGGQGDLVGSILAVVTLVTFGISRTDREYLVSSVPLRTLIFFAGALGLISVFLRP